MRRKRKHFGERLNLDSLVDIVSNNVGILIILSAFMALFTLADSIQTEDSGAGIPSDPPPKRLLVPWSHPTNKNHLYLAMRDNRVQFIDLRPFFRNLASRSPQSKPVPITMDQKGLKIRFFPVTNQIYCLEFTPQKGFGENWLQAQRPDSAWQGLLREFERERFILFFWVSGESFELFRQVRQSLWDRQYEVGWKPISQDESMEVCNGFEGSTAFRPQ